MLNCVLVVVSIYYLMKAFGWTMECKEIIEMYNKEQGEKREKEAPQGKKAQNEPIPSQSTVFFEFLEIENGFNIKEHRVKIYPISKEKLLRLITPKLETQNQEINLSTDESTLSKKLRNLVVEYDELTKKTIYKFKTFKQSNPSIIPKPPLSITNHYPDKKIPIIQETNNIFFGTFNNISVLGRGGFGMVFKATNIIDRRTYAVKLVFFNRMKIGSEVKRVLREIRNISLFNSENIVKYFNCWFEDANQPKLKIILDQFQSDLSITDTGPLSSDSNLMNESENTQKDTVLFIKMEFCSGGTLDEYLKKSNYLSRNEAFIFFDDLIKGLSEMHKFRIVHRDLK